MHISRRERCICEVCMAMIITVHMVSDCNVTQVAEHWSMALLLEMGSRDVHKNCHERAKSYFVNNDMEQTRFRDAYVSLDMVKRAFMSTLSAGTTADLLKVKQALDVNTCVFCNESCDEQHTFLMSEGTKHDSN